MASLRRIPSLLHGVLLLSFVLTACLPPALPPVIKIGLVAPFEGRYRYIGYDAIYAARLAVREINAAGGLQGWQLALVAYDDRGDPVMARSAAEDLAIDPDVVAVIGHYRQESTDAALEIYEDAGMPLLAVGSWLTGTVPLRRSLTAAPGQLIEGMLSLAPEAQGVAVWGEDSVAALLRERVVSRYAFITDPFSLQSGEVKADIAFSLLAPHVTGDRLSEWRAQSWEGRIIGAPDLAAAEFAKVAGREAEGSCFVTCYPFPSDVPDSAGWISAYRAVGPHVPEPGPYALPTYEAVYLLAGALAADITAHERPTREGAVEALSSVHREGYLGEIRWDASGFWEAAPLYTYCWEGDIPRLSQRLSMTLH